MILFSRRKIVKSTAFSEFIRKASSAYKKRVYTEVLKRASDRQNAVMRRDSHADK
jgi:hypothetical protein